MTWTLQRGLVSAVHEDRGGHVSRFFCETAWNLQTSVAPVSALCVLVPKKEVDDQRRSGPRVRSAWG